MTFSYILSSAIGYNLILIVCVILGILLAKKDIWGWLIYWIGVGFTAISLIGNIRKYLSFFGQVPTSLTASLIASIVIAIVGSILISKRRNKS
ncbi:MAG: hypothetical protein IKP86_10145 [Anaerolineaceae bacterium]|nr:hypothetical protein [Anaerolineaceae bacterium]